MSLCDIVNRKLFVAEALRLSLYTWMLREQTYDQCQTSWCFIRNHVSAKTLSFLSHLFLFTRRRYPPFQFLNLHLCPSKLFQLGSLKGMITAAVLSSYSWNPPKSSYHDCLTISIFIIFSLLHWLFHEMANTINFFSVLIIFELPPETADHSLVPKTLSLLGFPQLSLLFFVLFFWHSSEGPRFCVFLP